MGRASVVAIIPTSFMSGGSCAPMENSPPAIHTIPWGAGPGGVPGLGIVGPNAVAEGGEEACAEARLREYRVQPAAQATTRASTSTQLRGARQRTATDRENFAGRLLVMFVMNQRRKPATFREKLVMSMKSRELIFHRRAIKRIEFSGCLYKARRRVAERPLPEVTEPMGQHRIVRHGPGTDRVTGSF